MEAKKQTETSMEKIPHRTDHHEEGVGEEQGEREGTHPKVPAITDLMPPPRFIPPIVTGEVSCNALVKICFQQI